MKKRIFYLIVIVIAIAIWISRYININAYWESTIPENYKTTTYSMDEVVHLGDNFMRYGIKANGCSLVVTDFEIIEYDKYLLRAVPLIETSYPPEKLIIVDLLLRNNGTAANKIDLGAFLLHGIDQVFLSNNELIAQMNPILNNSTEILLSPDAEQRLLLFFNIREHNLSKVTFNNIDNYDMNLMVTVYPERKEVIVQS